MNQKDGEKILIALQDFINTELQAGNRVTKCNGNYLGGTISNEINQIITRDTDKEKMWEECGKEWLENKKEKEKEKNKNSKELKKIEDGKSSIQKTILDEKLKK